MVMPVPMTASVPDGYNLPPNTDSPVLLIIAVAAGVAVSVLLDRIVRKKRDERPPEDEDTTEDENGGENE